MWLCNLEEQKERNKSFVTSLTKKVKILFNVSIFRGNSGSQPLQTAGFTNLRRYRKST